MKLDPLSYPVYRKKLKMGKNPSIRPKTVKLSGENIGRKLHDIALSNEFLNITPKSTGNKKQIRQMGLYQT